MASDTGMDMTDGLWALCAETMRSEKTTLGCRVHRRTEATALGCQTAASCLTEMQVRRYTQILRVLLAFVWFSSLAIGSTVFVLLCVQEATPGSPRPSHCMLMTGLVKIRLPIFNRLSLKFSLCP